MELFDPNKIVSTDKDTELYIKELVEKIKKDHEFLESVKDLQLTIGDIENNAAMLNQYREEKIYCDNCPGYDYCEKENKHFVMSVIRAGRFLQSSYTLCDVALQEMQFEKDYLYRDFPVEWQRIGLEDISLKANRVRIPLVKEFVQIQEGESNRWLYLYGNNGIGKSYVAVALTNTFVRNGNGRAMVLDSNRRIKELSDLSRKNSAKFDDAMKELSNVELLVLDDFGNEYKSEYTRDMIVIPLLNNRAKNNKVTVFTSNFTIEEIGVLYSIGDKSGSIRSKQLLTILKNSCEKEFDLSGVKLF